jgi:hypothetical protein
MATGSEELERIGKALPPETLARLSELARVVPPEAFSAWVDLVRILPTDALYRWAKVAEVAPMLPALELSVARRALRAVTSSLDALDQESLVRIASEETDVEVLFDLLSSAALLEALEEKDPLAEARLKGLEEQRRLLREAGGAVGAIEAAEILGISRQAVDARRKKGRLLAVAAGRRGWRYPMAQFDGASEDGVVRGLERVLAAIDDEGGWMRLAFLLSPEERLGGERPLDALRRGEVEAVGRAARLYGEHSAY